MAAATVAPSPAPSLGGLPPLSLSTGPAISGQAPVSSGGIQTGDFYRSPRPSPLATLLPALALAGIAWLIWQRVR